MTEGKVTEQVKPRKVRVIDEIYMQLSRVANCEKELAQKMAACEAKPGQEATPLDPNVLEHLQGNIDDAEKRLRHISNNYLPSGSGFDSGTKIYTLESGLTQVAHTSAGNLHQDVIRLKSGYHHMDESGGYRDWSELKVAIRPCFLKPGFTLRITTPTYGNVRSMRDDDMDYWYDTFYHALTEEMEVPVNV